ncbi:MULTISPECIES: hypothetical protein [Shewanella]|uniref:Uncharacterized protein n=1 Tax=Shewanella nanhaiensis TaxID=2864872 RepID=A0ABS7E3Q2_9GAMM|nr:MULTISPECIES: hypothetical protein [Shewanella]MBW8184277.1 hypothetical protein [Shewanella nanhaiensis]
MKLSMLSSKVMVLSLLMLSLFSQQVFAENQAGKVGRINLYGGDWGNGWRGGMLYKLDTMPAGISYFTVRASDIAFDQFYALLLAAKHAKSTVTVTYNAGAQDANGYVTTLAIADN